MDNNQELERLNNHIDELFKKWQKLQPLKKGDQERFDKKIRLDWNYHSNKIEGNTLTYSETELLLIHGRCEGGRLERDYLEMQAHDVAINKVREFAEDKDRNLTEADVRGLNKIVLKEPFYSKAQTPDGAITQKKIIPGEYKKHPNHVRTATGEIVKFAEPHEVSLKMGKLMTWFNKEMENTSLSMASFLAELHHRFILIHPFDDGNGRVVRLWMNYVLLYKGYLPMVVRSNDRENYIIAINKADVGDMDAFAIYLGKVLISWLELGIKAGEGLDIEDPGDIDKEVDLFVKEQKSKGLHKYRSKEVAIDLVDHLWEVLFEPFKTRFKNFNDLFDSTQIDQIIKSPPLVGLHDRSFEDKEDIKKYLLEFFNTSSTLLRFGNTLEISTELQYIKYRRKNRKLPSFDISILLLLELNKDTYKVKRSNSYDPKFSGGNRFIEEERYYNQFLTKKEANDFIAEDQKGFLSFLRTISEKDADNRK